MVCEKGIYKIVTFGSYKRRYFPDRTFASPVRPDGLPLIDNSEKLQKQIQKEVWRFTEEDFNRWKLLSLMYLAGTIGFYLLTNLPLFVIPIVASAGISLYIIGKIRLSRDAEKLRQQQETKEIISLKDNPFSESESE